ncbi:50S ribosomal protein L25 [Clostridium sp. 'White wine YQ']|uniref:50S ribosomal protein L25 n=1 Tax=Clostridium sp. 'White wine YQ' TaxID=3027474 RepID=UPI002366C825|nr:50S ribosomal protein L25 [Clostridium sp. 'White wine YQ']MDD7793991.1 50S ribosomal protein L25 [Clostridium sp. 'White wine YQ']
MELKQREKLHNNANKIRRMGNVPGIVYGRAIQNFMFEVSELELNEEIFKHGEHGFLETNFNGQTHKTIIKEVQRDPVTRKIIHIDLEELKGNNEISSYVPIQFTGEDLVTKSGAVVQKEKKSVKVKCTPENLPKAIYFDISHGGIGSVYKLSDVEVGEEISILEDLNTVIAAISYERKTVSLDMELKEEEIREKRE